MDKTLRNTFIGSIVTILVAFIGAWIQLNSRIAVLEVQVKNDHETFQQSQRHNEENIKEIKTLLTQIQVGVQHLNDVKADK